MPEVDEESETRSTREPEFQVIVWDDPVNLMPYVTHVFQQVFGWSRDKGVEFMESVGLPRTDAEIETDRYIAWPAQALCYKVGQRAIQRTRAAIEKRDGDKFDIKSFHDHPIGHGQIPLPVFEAEMPNWVKPKA